MPKETMVTVLKRLRALDAQLAAQGILISEFARQKKVSQKTVRRDLAALKKLGYEAFPTGYERERTWRYRVIGAGLFASSTFTPVRTVCGAPKPKNAGR